ncbi:hypothetical protein EDB19DRAFT_2022486 [Suillus lakei]|nr:hypothetical protein EDB19DRAFT_2022486 [Suillus lakei]
MIAYLNGMHAANDTTEIQTLKEAFGLGDVVHTGDFAIAILNSGQHDPHAFRFAQHLFHSTPNNSSIQPVDWQDLQPYDGPGDMFCDVPEVKDCVNTGPQGLDLKMPFTPGATSARSITYYNYNKVDGGACGSYDAEYVFSVGPPEGQPAIILQIFASPHELTTTKTNIMYTGWNVDIPLLFFVNGLCDPWCDAIVSADGPNKPSTTSMPNYVGNGFFDHEE